MKVKIVVILIVFFIFGAHQLGHAWGWRPRPRHPVPPAPVAPVAPVAPPVAAKAPLPGSVVVVVVASGVLLLGLWRRKKS